MNSLEEDDIFYPDIDDYLGKVSNHQAVTTQGLEDLIKRVESFTGLSSEAATIVVRTYFQEIRNAVLKGEEVLLTGIGKLYINSPSVSKNKKAVTLKFVMNKGLKNKLNGKA